MRTDIAVDFDTGDLSLSERTPRYMVDFSWEKEMIIICMESVNSRVTSRIMTWRKVLAYISRLA